MTNSSNSALEKFFEIRVPSATDNLEIIRDFVTRVARKARFTEEDLNKLELAVDEACTNVMEHAYRQDETKQVRVEIEFNDERFIIDVLDNGITLDIDTLPPAPDIGELIIKRARGGLGLHLIRMLMDEVEFESKPGVGNHVRLVKYLTCK
ncbi:MAG: ATP-binding protein [Acidobacteriota bacterium]